MEPIIRGFFPCPVYSVRRNSNLDSTENKEIEDIIADSTEKGLGKFTSIDSYIFDTKLKKIKEFCEEHIKNYVKELLKPTNELNFYITQSWINLIKPGSSHHPHYHPNSILSGVFYIQSVENDLILFRDPNEQLKKRMDLGNISENNLYNSSVGAASVAKNELVIFPSWLEHSVPINKNATTDRISLAFNTFATGIFGTKKSFHELIL